MHVGAVAVFEAGPLAGPEGSVDAAAVERHVASRLHLLPRYRRKLAWTPLDGQPVWVDDERFNLRYHLRRARLPHPGDAAALKELTARILSEHLDRDKPLWELWIVEGLEGGRFALVAKVHHCMVDGAAGMNLLTTLYSTSPEARIQEAPPWRPRPAPGALELAVDDVAERVRAPLALARAAADALRRPAQALATLAEAGSAMREAVQEGWRVPARTPLNQRIGPHRRTDWGSLDLARVKDTSRRLDGTVNDVVLALVAGAIRSYLAGRGVPLADLEYKVCVPVNRREGRDDLEASNKVSALFVTLPVAEPDPVERFHAIREQTLRLKRTDAARGIELLTDLADLSGSIALTRIGVELATRLHPYNLIVSTVPGPQVPLYMLGARLLALHPILPLFARQGLGVAALSYDGQICWGLVGDWELAPDLAQLGRDLDAALEELEAASRLAHPGRTADTARDSTRASA
jgi:WS/DGAT/MGAT family acyltransferase